MQHLAYFSRRRTRAVPAALAVLSLVVVMSVSCRDAASARDAQMRLSKVISDFNQTVGDPSNKTSFRRIVAEAQKIKEDYPGSPSAQLAQYYVAVSEEFLGNTDQSERNLQELTRHGDPLMKNVARYALGELYKHHGNIERAKQVYKQLAASDGFSVHEHQSGHQSGSATEAGQGHF